jgi:hypothetical protein
MSSEKLTADEKQRKMMLIMGCMHCIERINTAIAKIAADFMVPEDIEDSFGDYNLFNSYFQFRKHEVLCILHAIHFIQNIYSLWKMSKAQYFPADI